MVNIYIFVFYTRCDW